MQTFVVDVSYSQIALFDGRQQSPFNDWSDRHILQGFSWREGSSSFKTLIESGPMAVEIATFGRVALADGSTRAISVPFRCDEGARIEVATITESHPIDLAPGQYQLVFETGVSSEGCWSRFAFIRDGDMQPRLLVEDRELDPTYPLLMDAEPA